MESSSRAGKRCPSVMQQHRTYLESQRPRRKLVAFEELTQGIALRGRQPLLQRACADRPGIALPPPLLALAIGQHRERQGIGTITRRRLQGQPRRLRQLRRGIGAAGQFAHLVGIVDEAG